MRPENGYVLISVLLALFVIASVSLNLNREGAFDAKTAANRLSSSKAKLTAQAGASHLLSQATKRNCSYYTGLPETSFGSGSYTGSIAPASGSPVTISVTATMQDGSYAEIKNENQTIYQAAKPLLSITTADGSDGDTYVNSSPFLNADDRNYSSNNYLSLGDDIFNAKRYALLKFDLSGLPSSVRILSAQLQLELRVASTDSTDASISVHRILTDWNPATATYNTSDGTTPWSWPDLYAASEAGTISMASTSPGLRTADLTDLVQAWSDSSFANYGLALAANSDLNSAFFYSSNASGSSAPPTLHIRFTCECGAYCDSTTPLPDSVAHWKLDETSGTTAFDSVGNNNGELFGTQWAVGQIDGAASFDGISDAIFVPHANELSFDKQMSVSAWIYLSTPNSSQTIISKGTQDQTEEYWLGTTENEIEFGIRKSGTWYGVNTLASGLELDKWHHAAISFDGNSNEVLFYVDGAITGNRTLTEDLSKDNDDLIIGSNQDNQQWSGMLDDIRLFDHIITANEVESLALAGGIGVSKTEYILDKFDSVSFSGNDGSISWATDWQEVGESDGANNGDVQVATSGDHDFAVIVQNSDNGGEGIQRQADLQPCTLARLVFEYKRSGFDTGSDDYVSVSASSDGGTNWTELDRIDRSAGDPGIDPDFIMAMYDITGFISSETMVRFITSPTLGASESMTLDNIEIRLKGCS